MNASQVLAFAKNRLHLVLVPLQIPGSQIWCCQVSVTPKMAADWLEQMNSKNRGLRSGTVARHAADMQAGRWVVSHQGIAFDEEGVISSGQHRLHACGRADVPMETLIFLNCPLAERKVIDQGALRNVRDIAALGHGDPCTTDEVSAARAMFYGIDIGATKRADMTPQEVYEFIVQHRKAIRFVLQAIEKKVKGITTATVIGNLCRAYYRMDREDLRHFIEVLVSGICQRKRDEVIIKLRERLRTGEQDMRSRDARNRSYGLTAAALLAYQSNEQPERLTVVREEIFSLPAARARKQA